MNKEWSWSVSQTQIVSETRYSRRAVQNAIGRRGRLVHLGLIIRDAGRGRGHKHRYTFPPDLAAIPAPVPNSYEKVQEMHLLSTPPNSYEKVQGVRPLPKKGAGDAPEKVQEMRPVVKEVDPAGRKDGWILPSFLQLSTAETAFNRQMLTHPEIAISAHSAEEVAAAHPAWRIFDFCCKYLIDHENNRVTSNGVLLTRFKDPDRFPAQPASECPGSNFYYDFCHNIGEFTAGPAAGAFDESLALAPTVPDDPPAPRPTADKEPDLRQTLRDQHNIIAHPNNTSEQQESARSNVRRLQGRTAVYEQNPGGETAVAEAGEAALSLAAAAVVDGGTTISNAAPAAAHSDTEPLRATDPPDQPLASPQTDAQPAQDAPQPQEIPKRASKARLRQVIQTLGDAIATLPNDRHDDRTARLDLLSVHKDIRDKVRRHVAGIKENQDIPPAEVEQQIEALELSLIQAITSAKTPADAVAAAAQLLATDPFIEQVAPIETENPDTEPLRAPQPAIEATAHPHDDKTTGTSAPQPHSKRRHRLAPAQVAVFLPAGQHRPQTQTISQGAPQ